MHRIRAESFVLSPGHRQLLMTISAAALAHEDHYRIALAVERVVDLFDLLVHLAKEELVACPLLVAVIHAVHSAPAPTQKQPFSGPTSGKKRWSMARSAEQRAR